MRQFRKIGDGVRVLNLSEERYKNGTVLHIKKSFGETSYYVQQDAYPHSKAWYSAGEVLDREDEE
jgi:hypothetical protein